MLFGENFSRSHKDGLPVVLDGLQHRMGRHNGFSGTHIALKQDIHLAPGLHALAYSIDSPSLGGR